jgi:phage gp29-like protein
MSAFTKVRSFFQPKSPLQGSAFPGQMGSQSAAADYRMDLTLQNLLALGAEFAPDDIIGLRKRARYGDARWLYALYDEMMRLGPASQVLKAREAIKSTQTIWNATPEEADEDENSEDPENKAARLIRDVTEEAWGKWMPDLKNHLSTKFFYGIAAMQVMWRPKAIENKWSRVIDIRPIPARRFRLDPLTMRFKFLANPYSWEGPFVDDLQAAGKLIFVEVGADTEPLDQRGLLFQCLIPWAFMQYAVRWRGKKLQNFGMPPVMVKYPKGDPQNKAVADALADMLANGTRASLPDSMSAELLAAASSGSARGDVYEGAIEWVTRTFDQIILGHGQVSGVQVGAGSRSSTKDAIGLFKDVTNSRAQEIDVDLGQQCWGPYVDREFGSEWAENHAPTTTSRCLERDDPTELSIVLMNSTTAGLAGTVAAEDSVERMGLKVAEDGELTMAGNVKGEHPAPAEVAAINKAQPPAFGEQAHVKVDAAGKAVQTIKKPPPPPPGAPPAGNVPGQRPPGMAKAAAPSNAQQGAAEKKQAKAGFATMVDVQAPAAAVLARKKKSRVAHAEFYTKRQRFGAAALVGGKPRVVLTSFGHEHGAPSGTSMNIDVRSMAAGSDYPAGRTGQDPEVKAALEKHPMTGAIYGGTKSQVVQAIKAGSLTGDSDINIGIGCEHGKHRGPYVAERLGQELRSEGHDVRVEHRDATDAAGRVGIGLAPEDEEFENARFSENEFLFYSEDQPRDDHGRWGEGGGASAVEKHIVDSKGDQGRPLTGSDSRKLSDIVPGSSRVNYLGVPGVSEMHDRMGVQPSLTVDPAKYSEARAAAFQKEPLERLRIKDLTFTQPRVNMGKVKAIAEKSKEKRNKAIMVVRANGKNYVMDGHHHVASRALRGKEYIDARVMSVHAFPARMAASTTVVDADMYRRLTLDPDDLLTAELFFSDPEPQFYDGWAGETFAVVHFPKKPAGVAVSQARLAARVRAHLKGQHAEALQKLEEAKKAKGVQ